MAIKHKKLQEWVAAGVISPDQAESIHAYEEVRKQGKFGRAMVGLSLLAILIGVLSIIASNWSEIPGLVKIGAHVTLNIGVGFFSLWAAQRGHDLLREGAALAFFGLSFTLIILVGQVFQMGGKPEDAVILWMLITLPFFLLMGRGYMTAVPWMIGFLALVFFVIYGKIPGFSMDYKIFFILAIAGLLPLALIGCGICQLFKQLRPALCDVSLKTGLLASAVMTSMSLQFWQVSSHTKEDIFLVSSLIVLGSGIAGILAHAAFHRFYKNDPVLKHGALFAVVSLISFSLPFMLHFLGHQILSAIAFIGYWIFIGWIAQDMHKMRLVSLAIAVIAIRIFVLYIELFGTLMDTGFGLICGGIVMLVLLYGARRLNTRMTKSAVNA